ncbi:MAG: aspartyl protease family protein [Candidatus Eisenbacteria bacterium]
MSVLKTTLVSVLAGTALFAGLCAAQELSDPYEILGKHFEVSGGLMLLKAEQTQYFEGNLSLAGMQGPIKAWTAKPDRSRAEVVIGPISITQGETGDLSWILDTNGKVQVITKEDEATQKRKEVARRMADYEHADPGSDVFTAAFEGTETVDETDCYVVKVTNSINTDHFTYYIGKNDFLLKKRIAIQAEKSGDSYYGDYREVSGLLVPFYTREIPHQTGQAQEITIVNYESNPELDPAIFNPPEQGGKDFEFTAGDAAENIPVEFIGNHLFIPVTVNGKEDLWVLDTGAGMSVITTGFAEELGLDLEGNLKGVGAGGTVDASFAQLPPYQVSGISFKGQTVAVIDMSELMRRLGIDVPGILGYDFLSRFVTKVDYANELVSFYDPGTFDYTGDGQELDVHRKESVFETSATLDGEHSGTWLFDLGAGMTHLDGAYALREGYTEKRGILAKGHGAGNEMLLKAIKSDKIELAGFTITEPHISFSYGGTDTVLAADKIGILGNTLFRNFVLYVDYANERVIVEKGERFNEPWPEDHSGLSFGWTVDWDAMEVLYVSPDTPADQAGFEDGDILLSVDGESVDDLGGVIGLRELLKQEPGTVLEIAVRRDGKERKLSLTLADLFE